MGLGTSVILMVAAAGAVAILARKLKLPYTVALVLGGLALGAAPDVLPILSFDQLRLTPDLLFHVFLPALLFEAAFHLSWRKFRENLKAILLLAVPGVLMAVAIGGVLAWLVEPLADAALPLTVAFLFVSMLAATDPVSVVALFKELGVPKRLAVLMEGEALLNDGVAVVAFITISAVLGLEQTHEPVTTVWVVRFLLWEVAIGIAVGAGIGLVVSWITTLVDDHLIEIMLTTIAAFGSYVAAESLHASFVLAVVAAGMATGNVGARFGMTPTNRIAVESFWEYVVFMANSFVFLLLGKEIALDRLAGHWLPILIAYGVLTVARAIVIGTVTAVLSRTRERLPKSWPPVLIWGGLRGSLSMVLALSLPTSFAQRGLLLDLTFGVVLISILVQGLTMSPLLRWTGVVSRDEGHAEYMRARGALRAVRAALHSLDSMLARGEIHQTTFESLRESFGGRLAALEEQMAQLEPRLSSIYGEEMRTTQLRLLDVEREAIRRAETTGVINDEVARALLKDINDRIANEDVHGAHERASVVAPQASPSKED